MTVARLIALSSPVFTENSPALNMAIDQAILESVDEGAGPTLRLYQWSEPTLSLGYFQRAGDRSLHATSQSLAMVRRATGGGAIVHHHELTYSFVCPITKSLVGARSNLYKRTHQAIVQTLAQFGVRAARYEDQGDSQVSRDPIGDPIGGQVGGQIRGEPDGIKEPFLCFARRTDEDLIVAGYKVTGSAQRTARRAVLQHGSILMDVSPFAPELPGVNTLASKQIDVEAFAEKFAAQIEGFFSIHLSGYQLDPSLRQRARRIVEERFGSTIWNKKR
ncbi:Octanoyltransferase LipM [Planctomycetes bacterium CA13]|uniref:Octanoyltransferase LipM n=1 Tax=Novipirellula herctigrandis TaxID=2527986 RepID=A0A5C5ZA08_9BACT|nr:Octanoyltransferase LipM [Planctomycetes bacterium CA13]